MEGYGREGADRQEWARAAQQIYSRLSLLIWRRQAIGRKCTTKHMKNRLIDSIMARSLHDAFRTSLCMDMHRSTLV